MATGRGRSQRINLAIGWGTFMLLGLGLLAGLNCCECPLSAFFGIPVKTALEALPSFLLAAWHFLGPCLCAHIRLLDGLLQVSLSCGQLALAFAGVG
jgi:hypothetical protein